MPREKLPAVLALADAFAQLRAADVDLVAVNCVAVSAALLDALTSPPPDATLAAFPGKSAGLPAERGGVAALSIRSRRSNSPATRSHSRSAARDSSAAAARVGPEHIASLAEARLRRSGDLVIAPNFFLARPLLP